MGVCTVAQSYADMVVESLAVGVIVIDPRGFIGICNSAAAEILGIDAAVAVGQPYDRALSIIDGGEVNSVMRFVQKTGKRCLGHLLDVAVDKGHRRTVKLTATPFLAGEGVEVALTLEDVTAERHWAQEALRSDRLAALGRLAAGIAHEIRNPLTSIRGFAQRLSRRVIDHSEEERYISIIVEEVDRLNRVVSALTEFSKPSLGIRRVIDIDDILEKAVLLSAVDMRERITVVKQVEPDLPELDGDPERLRQALINVLVNAVQAMPDGGMLCISAAQDGQRPVIRISVTDSGVGIPESDLEHIFDPFYTTKEAGTGMGLAISHQILADHGGELMVASAEGEGTTVILELPTSVGRGIG